MRASIGGWSGRARSKLRQASATISTVRSSASSRETSSRSRGGEDSVTRAA